MRLVKPGGTPGLHARICPRGCTSPSTTVRDPACLRKGLLATSEDADTGMAQSNIAARPGGQCQEHIINTRNFVLFLHAPFPPAKMCPEDYSAALPGEAAVVHHGHKGKRLWPERVARWMTLSSAGPSPASGCCGGPALRHSGPVSQRMLRASLAARTHARSTILPRLASAAEAVAGDVPARSTWPGVDASVFIYLPA